MLCKSKEFGRDYKKPTFPSSSPLSPQDVAPKRSIRPRALSNAPAAIWSHPARMRLRIRRPSRISALAPPCRPGGSERPDQMPGMWRRYYTRWRVATRERLDLRLLELMPPLAALCPPATVIDKTRYSALAELKLAEHLRQREADALIVSGSETDVCVLATVLDAVDIGYRVIVVRDAVCSSSDEGHNMLMRLCARSLPRLTPPASCAARART
jgi:hypothetical protein